MSTGDGRLPAAFLTPGTPSFVDFLARYEPTLLPGARGTGAGPAGPIADLTHATTIVAVGYAGGVVMAGDRRATSGSMIASRHIEKVFPADDHCAIGIAGVAGLALELVRLFQLELEHYEKIEGAPLSLDGKANRLATMIRSALPLALQGLGVVPVLAGYDAAGARGRIFSFDVTGGRYEELDYHAVGSGSLFAKGSLKKRWSAGLDEPTAVRIAVEALLDAADDDSATGGPDLLRGILPVVAVVDEAGYRVVDDAALRAHAEALAEQARGSGHGGASTTELEGS